MDTEHLKSPELMQKAEKAPISRQGIQRERIENSDVFREQSSESRSTHEQSDLESPSQETVKTNDYRPLSHDYFIRKLRQMANEEKLKSSSIIDFIS